MIRPSILLALAILLCIATPKITAAQPSLAPPKPYDTTLFTAIRSGNATALQQQLDRGSDPNATQNGISALEVATLAGTPQQMKILLARGAKPNYADDDGITALFLAIPDTEKTTLLLDHGADPNQHSKANYSPLIKLANCPGTTDLLRILIAKGADPKQAARDNALLYWAAGTDDTALVGLILRLGFNANDTVLSGDYPINSALTFRCSNTLKMLVDHGADVNVALPATFLPNTRGLTALMQAAVADDEASFFYLLDHGADVNARCKTGYTALMLAQLAETDHPEITKALLAHGARAADKNPAGDNAITLAAKKGNTESLRLLKQQ
jgi:ankyrin repeat protein